MFDIALGPFFIPAQLTLLSAAIVAAFAAGAWLARRARTSVERSLWIVLGLMLLAARVAFVLRYRPYYFGEPLRMLDIRDGGFRASAALAAGLAAAAWIAWRHAGQRRPLGAALAAGLLVWGAGSAALRLATPHTLPDQTLPALDGGVVALASMTGKPLVVNLWASWCPPCRREMPDMAKAQAGNPDVVFVFANQGEAPEAVRAYLQREGLDLHNVLLDGNSALARKTGSRGLPTTLFFDARGRLVERRAGTLSAAALEQRLEALRARPALATAVKDQERM